MEAYLGIYLSEDKATVVCLDGSRDEPLLGCFNVSVEKQIEHKQQTLASLIAQGCGEKGLKFSEAAIALDCAMFMQHNVHSDFDDPKKIAATVRFDTEEALATDITDWAMTFQVDSSDQDGSQLTVFTADRKTLSDILLSLQGYSIDPVTVEPDISCLARFIAANVPQSEPGQGGTLFALLSQSRGYFVVVSGSRARKAERTFFIGSMQDRQALLEREALVTIASTKRNGQINHLKVFDSADSVSQKQLRDKLGTEVDDMELPSVGNDIDPTDFAIAYGAALACSDKTQSTNFRNDFMPYQGKRVRLQKTLKFLSVSLTILLLAIGLYAQVKLWQKNNNRSRLNKKLQRQYAAVMFGKNPPAKINPVSKLAGELRRIKAVKSGLLSITGDESIPTKLTLILEALNKCAEQTDLNIESISISSSSISIAGDTSSRRDTLKVFDAMRATKLAILRQRLNSENRRDNFSITVELQQ